MIFQFCIHLMNLYIFKAYLPPGSGSGWLFLMLIRADPDPPHCRGLPPVRSEGWQSPLFVLYK